ncbi:MAG: DoxX family protein [Pseudomonadales bacterium]|nr:DoxX family protein [Pseudomonadales bacterium]MDG1441974.1 DoxX family protein [Pseudomonadales bacterium]
MNQYLETFCLLSGRFLLGVYFILPGISKITGFDATLTYMNDHNVPIASVLLIVTIIIQLGAGAALIVGFKAKYMAFVLAGLTLVISIYMHNFWDLADDDANRAHETQNFFKNMGIMAGLLMVAALGAGKLSLDSKLSANKV